MNRHTFEPMVQRPAVRVENRTFGCLHLAESVEVAVVTSNPGHYIQGNGVIQSIRKVHERRLTD